VDPKNKIIVSFIVAAFFAAIAYGSFQIYKTVSKTDYFLELIALKKKLPIMLDSETELYGIYFIKHDVVYVNRLINMDAGTITNRELFYNLSRNDLLKNVCNKANPNRTLQEGDTLIFKYTDKNRLPLFDVVIKPSDCRAIP
jgi:hypothetical protein